MAWTIADVTPWRDRAGRFSGPRLCAFLVCLLPLAAIAWEAAAIGLGPKPVISVIREIGDWVIRLLLLTLAVSPARHLFNAGRLVQIRRMLGLAALFYVLGHLALYFYDQRFVVATIVSEIVLRFYLTIGFVAILGLVALGVTSTDASIRRLGAARWRRLHQLVYPLTILALWHSFLQAKSDVSEPVLMSGLFFWLMGWRALKALGRPTGLLSLLCLAIVAGLATAGVEALWYGTQTGVNWRRVLAANLAVDVTIRPALWVAGAGLVVALASAAWLRGAAVLVPRPLRSAAE